MEELIVRLFLLMFAVILWGMVTALAVRVYQTSQNDADLQAIMVLIARASWILPFVGSLALVAGRALIVPTIIVELVALTISIGMSRYLGLTATKKTGQNLLTTLKQGWRIGIDGKA